jgi:hypothetical protein
LGAVARLTGAEATVAEVAAVSMAWTAAKLPPAERTAATA